MKKMFPQALFAMPTLPCALTLALLLLLTAGHIAHGQDKHEIQLSAGAMYQHENFHWSIAGNASGQDPNIYSELKWKNIGGPGYFAECQWLFLGNLIAAGGYNQSYTHSGSSNDTDYHGDNRTMPVYDQSFSSGTGGTRAGHIGVGYIFIKKPSFAISSIAGYGTSCQSYYMEGNKGIYERLNTSYASNWRGPFVQIQSQIKLRKKLDAHIGLACSMLKYHADADWNLITGFQHPRSFSDMANGYGADATATLSYAVCHYLHLIAAVDCFGQRTGRGADVLYLIDGETNYTQFNGAVRYGWDVRCGLSARW